MLSMGERRAPLGRGTSMMSMYVVVKMPYGGEVVLCTGGACGGVYCFAAGASKNSERAAVIIDYSSSLL